MMIQCDTQWDQNIFEVTIVCTAIRVGKKNPIECFKNIMAPMDGQNRLPLAGQKRVV